jgi:hypothetical protein
MIISDIIHYVFIDTPKNASTVIRRELCVQTVCRPACASQAHQLSGPSQFPGQKAENYVIFASRQKPMDIVVSKYFKARIDHNSVFNLEW